MVRHQQFHQSAPSLAHVIGISIHHHFVFGRTYAGGREYASANVYNAYAAYTHRRFVLLMTERWDRDVLHASRVEHRGSQWNRNWHPIDRQLNLLVAHDTLSSRMGQTPSGQRLSRMCASTSSRKCSRTEVSGAWANWPSPQIDVSFSASVNSSINSMSALVPFPCVQLVRISTIFCEPIRHGTHFPHDSLRKNFTAFKAISSMQRPSAQTTIAPEPSIEPMAASDSQSSRT